MSNHWDFYLCRVNDIPSSIFLDLGVGDKAPDPARPHLIWIWVPMRTPRPDGLSSSDEAPTLIALEESLTASFERELDATFVGRITGANRREFYFYARAAGDYAAAVQRVFAVFPGYAPEMGDQEDNEW